MADIQPLWSNGCNISAGIGIACIGKYLFEVWGRVGIGINLGKMNVWNAGGVESDGCLTGDDWPGLTAHQRPDGLLA